MLNWSGFSGGNLRNRFKILLLQAGTLRKSRRVYEHSHCWCLQQWASVQSVSQQGFQQAAVRIVSNKIGSTTETEARMYAKNEPLEMPSSADLHDRTVFIDQRGWIIGQSTKDAARRKPTLWLNLMSRCWAPLETFRTESRRPPLSSSIIAP